MSDYFLKFPDEATAKSVLYTEETPNFKNIDIIGTLYATAPEPLPDNYVPVPFDGFHVNVRTIDGEDGSTLEPFSVVPAKPRRVWG